MMNTFEVTGFYSGEVFSSRLIDDEVSREIKDYRTLPKGWDYGVGDAPSTAVIEKGLYFYNIGNALGFNAEPHPLTDGGISIIFYFSDHFLDVDINRDLSVDLNYEIGIGSRYSREWRAINVNVENVLTKLQEIKERCSNLYEPLSSHIIVEGKKGLEASMYFEIT